MDVTSATISYEHVPTLLRLGLALAIGLFIGLERERRGKEAGLRTFGFAALIGGMGGLLGESYSLLSITLLGLLIAFLNIQTLRANEGTELTTSAALLVTGFAGVLAGQGHTFTPVAVGVMAAALLAWKERLAGFSLNLTDVELRSAILLGILAFVVYPALPDTPIDPWGLVEPRVAWVTVILIAALGFVNYVLLKVYGARGVELTGFLGGLVNSTVTVTELSARVRDTGGYLAGVAYQGVLLSTAAMIARNLAILTLLASGVLGSVVLPLGLMLAVSIGLSRVRSHPKDGKVAPALQIESPFSLSSAIKFGLIFLALQIVSTIAQDWLGPVGFYAVSIVGGVVSSASAVAAAATLAEHGRLTPLVAGTGAVLASLASAVINLPLVARVAGDATLTRRLSLSLALVVLAGITGIVLQHTVVPSLDFQALAALRPPPTTVPRP
jgi:uncharacterized membrane protein (DUF4010 family)